MPPMPQPSPLTDHHHWMAQRRNPRVRPMRHRPLFRLPSRFRATHPLARRYRRHLRERPGGACTIFEVLTYQGLHAVLLHRLAHTLYLRHSRSSPRLISQFARLMTGGIEIIPARVSGRRFFIDHGTGVVIGETAEIGDNVMLYHQVTLGATGWWKHRGDGRVKCHPTIGDNVTIGVGASILGPITVGMTANWRDGVGARIAATDSVVMAQPARLQIRPGSTKELEPQWDEVSGNDYVIWAPLKHDGALEQP